MDVDTMPVEMQEALSQFPANPKYYPLLTSMRDLVMANTENFMDIKATVPAASIPKNVAKPLWK